MRLLLFVYFMQIPHRFRSNRETVRLFLSNFHRGAFLHHGKLIPVKEVRLAVFVKIVIAPAAFGFERLFSLWACTCTSLLLLLLYHTSLAPLKTVASAR